MNHQNSQTQPKKRLDMYLAELYPDVSRSFLQKLCSTDQVLVNGNPEKSGYKLRPEDKVTMLYDMEAIEKIEDIDLPILYQDDDVIVINKPVGVISHARGKFWNEPSVASFIRQLTSQPGDRAGIVHRLDRATSGVMICAKTQAAMIFLQEQFAARQVKKIYMAVVKGHLEPVQAIVDMPIERNPKAPSTFRVGTNGKTSQTKYYVEDSSDEFDLVRLEPATGRTHQLRVHMAYLKHPILGDTLYNGPTAARLYLHAQKLTLRLPSQQKSQTFTAPLPVEFKRVIKTGIYD